MIAQVNIPSEGLSSGYYSVLLLAAVIYALLYVAARVLEGRDNPRAAIADNIGFAVAVLAAAYVVVLAVVAFASEFDLVYDMMRIIGVVVVFFAVLVGGLFLVFELGLGRLGRRRRAGGG